MPIPWFLRHFHHNLELIETYTQTEEDLGKAVRGVSDPPGGGTSKKITNIYYDSETQKMVVVFKGS